MTRFRAMLWVLGVSLLAMAGCGGAAKMPPGYQPVTPTTGLPLPEARADSDYTRAQIAQGRYLVGLLGCGSCHTDGALLGEPGGQPLAGSRVGIAYTNPMVTPNPGIVYPGNLTPDPTTGLGRWSDEDIVDVLTTGEDRMGHTKVPVMPWTAYSRLKPGDAYAIAAYLRSLPPVKHRVPKQVLPGQESASPYVHVGYYRRR